MSAIRLPMVALAIALLAAPRISAAADDCPVPASLYDGWQIATHESESMSRDALCAMGPRITE
jgi:hypothetical protein